MKFNQNMMFLRKENVKGVSAKTNKAYDFNNFFFLDEEMQEVKVGAHKECTSDLSKLTPMVKYNVLLNLSIGNYVNVDILQVHEIPVKS